MPYLGFNLLKIFLFCIGQYWGALKYYLKFVVTQPAGFARTFHLKGSKKGKRLILLANGPSVKKLDPKKIVELQSSGFEVMALNSYISSDLAAIVRPDLYVLTDPNHFGENYHHITEGRQREVEEDFRRVIAANIPLFVPFQFFPKLTKRKNVYPLCDVEVLSSSNATNVLLPRGYHSMTAYKGLAFGCYMAYDAIYICGFDNDQFKKITVDEENNLWFRNDHFYAKGAGSGSVFPVPLADGKTTGELLYMYHVIFKGLEKFGGFPIYNLDPESLVNCFSKKHGLDVYRAETSKLGG